MKFDTAFSTGDKAWILDRDFKPVRVTIGKIEITYTDSPGLEGEEIFDNYKSQTEYTERYMAVETGIGTGSVYTLGKHIFKTQPECVCAINKLRGKTQ